MADGRAIYKKLELDGNGNPWCIVQNGPTGNHLWIAEYGYGQYGNSDGCPSMNDWDDLKAPGISVTCCTNCIIHYTRITLLSTNAYF